MEEIERYEILEKIGQGSFAVVYRAYDTWLQRTVALKELRQAGWTADFRQEARTIARLDHPRIVTIHDIYQADDRFFIVMGLVEGPSLAQLIADRGRLAWSEAMEMMEAIAEGLDYAHAQGVVHCDLKPANILVEAKRGALLTDFGLAKLAAESSDRFIVGTPHYIPPEMWENGRATPQSDVYALGCILFEILLGEPLFGGQSVPEIMMAHFRSPAWPGRWPEDSPAALIDILQKALARRPADRYPTAGAMIAALRRLEDDQATPPPDILTTRLQMPHLRPALVSRPRLLERLEAGLQRVSGIFLISAPAGFGKTTLVCHWLSQLELPLTWLSLEEEDNDPARFLIYLVAALQKAIPEIGSAWPDMKHSRGPTPTITMTRLINALSVLPPAEPRLLVLDDYQLIENEVIHEALTMLVEHLPPGLRLILITRSEPPLPLARLRARGQLVELGSRDLRFTPEEAAQFLNRVMALALSETEIATLEERTEGWVAGLQLAALSLQGREDIPAFIESFGGDQRYILDYLASETLQRQPEHIHRFLRQTAILDQLSGPLCRAVTGQADSQAILEQLERANLFIVPLDESRRWYRYHRLFADFLRGRLSGEEADLHRRAGRWYAEQGMTAEAIQHTLAAEDFEQAAHLIEQEAQEMLVQSQLITLRNWLDKLPEPVIRARPKLCIYHAWTLFFTLQHIEARYRLDQAEAALEALAQSRPTAFASEIAALRAFIAIMRGDLSIIVQYAHQAREYLPEDNPFLQGLVAMLLAVPPIMAGDVEAADLALTETVRISQEKGNFLVSVISLTQQGEIQIARGRLHRAAALNRQALRLAVDQAGQPLPVASMAHIGLAMVLYQWNELETAAHHLEVGLAVGAEWGALFNFDGYITLAMVRQGQQDEAGAQEAIKRAMIQAQTTVWTDLDDVMVNVYQARLDLMRGDMEGAARWVRQYTARRDQAEQPYLLREVSEIILARYLIAQNKPAEALAILAELLEAAERLNRFGVMIELLVWQAAAYQARSALEPALSSLKRAFALAEPEGYIRVFMDAPALAGLIRRLAPAHRYARRLLAAFEELPAGTEPPFPLLDPLSERELEVLQAVAEGLTNQAVADRLIISVGTVKKHLNNIYSKLDVHNRTEAVARAKALGLW